jgi:hypothetical protein
MTALSHELDGDNAWMDELLFDAIMTGHVDDVPSSFEPTPIPTKSDSEISSTPPAPISVGSAPDENDWQDDGFDFDLHVEAHHSPRISHAPVEMPRERASVNGPLQMMNMMQALSLPFQTQTQSRAIQGRVQVSPAVHASCVTHTDSSIPLVGKHMGLDYIDYADVPEQQQAVPVRERNTGGVQSPFPERLHDMLTADNFSEIVSWAPHGRCFVVRHPKEFQAKVLELYFNQTKYRSFQRQLNLYGFRRITGGADRGGYYHPLMLRGRRKLCTRMCRQKASSGKHGGNMITNALVDPELEPNFYAMEPVGFIEAKKPLSAQVAMTTPTSISFHLSNASPLTAALFGI